MKLLIVADDLTGALDTGVQLAKAGASTTVAVLEDANTLHPLPDKTDVLVVDTQTRHTTAREAYERVYRVVRQAMQQGAVSFYKKTDSTLRGNIGSELQAMMDAVEAQQLAFVPAFPQEDRLTIKGVQWVNGRPVNEGDFAGDLFEPVTGAYIPGIIAKQTELPTTLVSADALPDTNRAQRGILLFDASSESDLLQAAQIIIQSKLSRVTAGCAGFATMLPMLTGLGGMPRHLSVSSHRLAVICGSTNPTAQRQIAHAQQSGSFFRRNLTANELLGDSFDHESLIESILHEAEGKHILVDAMDTAGEEKLAYARAKGISLHCMRETIAERLGAVASGLCRAQADLLPLLVGGDTLFGFLSQTQCRELCPLSEPETGCVLSVFEYGGTRRPLLSKSGGFGGPELFAALTRLLKEELYAS